MQKSALKKLEGSVVRIRPVAKRFDGHGGPMLPDVDDDWCVRLARQEGVRIENIRTGHGTIVGYDQIHHWTSDPVRGKRYGFLILNVQVHIGGIHLWIEPTLRPGERLP